MVVYLIRKCKTASLVTTLNNETAACRVVVKVLDLDPQWFHPWCGHDKICTAVGLFSKALNPTLLQGKMSPALSNQL